MLKFFWVMIFATACAQAQSIVPATSNNASTVQKAANTDDLSTVRKASGKVSLVRGVLKRVDPVYDQLVVHAFGGRDIRIAFDGQTQFLSDNAQTDNPQMRSTSIPAGSVVSVDTVIDNGKLFARAVRTSGSHAAELDGQVVSYDAAKSQLVLRDNISPEHVSLRITPSTTVVKRGQPASPQVLFAGMLVRVSFSAAQNAAEKIEILAEPGRSFTFAGRIVAVDLRSHVLSLWNDSDQSLRDLAFDSVDTSTLNLLREGATVSVQAEFDGDRYNVRAITSLAHTP
jgi:hypothetical protein